MFDGVVNNEEDEAVSAFTFGNIQLTISTAEDDFNQDKKTLFATHVWNGSIVLSRMLVVHRNSIEGKSVIEFGAASGIPSMLSAKLGAKLVCASDYPSPSVLDNLRRNCERNGADQVHVAGHIWGEDASPLLDLNCGSYYDIAMAAECLWRHECHSVLLQSILSTLKSDGGKLFLTYSHHIPGLEAEDDAFVAAAMTSGFSVETQEQEEAPHMWNENKNSVIYFLVLVRS